MRFLLPVLLTCVLAVTGCVGGTDAVDQAAGGEFRFVSGTGSGRVIPVSDRRAAPAVTVPFLTGAGSFDLPAHRGKVVILNFWASWCPPCRVEMPEFDAVYRSTRRRGVEFVGVNTKDIRDAAQAFVTRAKVSYPNTYDPTGRVTLSFRGFPANGFPYTIVIDRQGRVAGVYPIPLLQNEIASVIATLTAEK